MANEPIRPEFSTTLLSDDGLKKSADIRDGFSKLLTELERMLDGNMGQGFITPEVARLFAVTRTHMETAAMFAVKAIARDPRNKASA